MQGIKDRTQADKYLKPTAAASYRGTAGAYNSTWSGSVSASTRNRWSRLVKQMQMLFGDLVVSNLLLAGYILAMPASTAKRISMSAVSPLKMAFHWCCAVLLIVLLFPILLLIALAIKLDSPGPAIYRQQRVGVNRRRGQRRNGADNMLGCRRKTDRRKENLFGRPFTVFKFRTMVVDAEKRCGPVWATKNDPRVTRVGRFLRRTRLDELPQLFNVVRGDMSLVGPRPERVFFIEKLSRQVDGYTRRLDVLPGITGLAQVERGYDSTVDDVRTKVHYDLEYIKETSLISDIKILFRTVGVVFGARGM
jgi:lipopolysaccharide/colanic/teichoic acid biosynthesis glycosyltransferase